MDHLKIPRNEWVRIEDALESVIPMYELMNRLLSVGLIDAWWRGCARTLTGTRDVLELGCGVGGLTRHIRSERLVCTDPSMMMLVQTRRATGGRHLYVRCAAEGLPFRSGSFDAVCSTFAFRDFTDKERALREAHRVIRSGGRVVIVEIAKPNRVLASFISWYFRTFIPIYLRILSPGDDAMLDSWMVLPETYERFGHIHTYQEMMRRVGFEEVSRRYLLGGFAVLLSGVKP